MRKLHTLFTAILINLFLFSSVLAFSQTAPSSYKNVQLRQWLKQNYFDGKHTRLGYTRARRYMYNNIDNYNNKITCVYSGYIKSWSYGGTGTNPYPINCEHTVPQSFFNKSEPMKSDLHHLFPTYANWNSTRSNYPFDEISDTQTDKWMYQTSSTYNKPSSNIDAYSEYANSEFEPREDHKGNVARAIFYFYTMYPTQAGSITRVADPDVLYQWHLADPVDSKERDRNNKVETYQGDRNPYIDHPEYVGRAWGYTYINNNNDDDDDDNGDDNNTNSSGDIFISEYVEGTSYNKAIEIYNGTNSTVSLSNITLKKQSNGSGSWYSLSLNGSIAPSSTFVIAHSNADYSLRSKADMTSSSSVMSFNGNDPIALFQGSTMLDIVGTYNGGSAYFAKDIVLARKSNITEGTTDFDISDWNSLYKTSYSGFGSHTVNKSVKLESTTTLKAQAYPNPVTNTLNIININPNDDIKIINSSSKVIAREKASTTRMSINVSDLPKGIYFIHIYNTKDVETIKFVK
ncbi:MAG: endonuclease [Hyphomicrobiales bacterium]